MSRERAMPRATLDQRPKNSAAYQLDEQVGFLLRVAMQRHSTIFTSEITGNLTAPQFSALVKLLQEGPLSQNHLGRLIYLDVATIKGVVERLRASRPCHFERRSARCAPPCHHADADRPAAGRSRHSAGGENHREDPRAAVGKRPGDAAAAAQEDRLSQTLAKSVDAFDLVFLQATDAR